MAMLAEPRRKQKVINLRAKNNAWSNDQNKFGQRMLEKMGWSAGKGLGANENGIVEHVIARYKNDEKGLGFEDKNDQWTKHEDDFNALLSNLSQASGSEEKLHSGISLEDKSKKSKARVHYHKFTRGKDLTRYSEKDLANIFGKKSFKENKQKTELPQKVEAKTTAQIFTEKGSMEDYFKSKLASLKSKSKVLDSDTTVEGASEYAFKAFSMDLEDQSASLNDKVEQDFKSYDLNEHESNDIALNKVAPIFSEHVKQKKSKKKKNKFKECEVKEKVPCDENAILNSITDYESCNVAKAKSKKSKRKNHESIEAEGGVVSTNDHESHLEEQHDEYIPKKKKKKKIKNAEM